MKIINICVNLPYTDGFTYQENLLPKYHKINGHDVYVLASDYVYNTKGKIEKTNPGIYADKDGLKVIRLESKKYFIKNFMKYDNFYNTICEIKPDIIYCHLFQFLDIADLIRYKKEHPEVKLYADNHADSLNSGTNWISKNILHKIIWKYYAHKLYPYVEKFYGVLPVRVEFLKKIYGLPSEKLELLVMGADDEEIERITKENTREIVRKKYNIKIDDILIVTGGKINHNKLETINLLEAVNKIDNNKLKLIFFGSINDELKDKVLSLCNDRVKYIGWLNTKETYNIFSASDLVIFPGLHSVYWEQVAGMGIPMIVKKLPGTDHVNVSGNTLLMDKPDTKKIYNAIKDLTENKEKFEKMKAEAKKAVNIFSYREIAKRSIGEK